MGKEFGAISTGVQDPLTAQRNELTRQGLKPTFSPWEGFVSSFGGNWSIDYLIEAGKVGALKSFPMEKMSPSAIKDEYGIEVEEPMNWLAAQQQSVHERRRADKELVLNNIRQNARGSTALPLIGALLDGVADPMNVVSMGLVGVPFGMAGKALGLAGRGMVARGAAVAAELGAEGLLEGYVQNKAMDIHSGVFGYERTEEERNAVLRDSMLYNVLLGGAIHAGRFAYSNLKNKYAKAQSDIKYYENAKRPRQLAERLDAEGKARPNQPDYPGPKAGGDGVFYTVHHADGGNFSVKTQNNLGVKIGGDGIVLTSNNGRARNSAVQRPQAVNGQVLSVKVPELNLLDIDQISNPEIRQAILDVIGKDRLPNDVVKEALDAGSTRDIIETLTRVDDLEGTSYVKDLNTKLQEQGVDGYTLRNKDGVGKLTADDSLYLFDPDKVLVENIEDFNVQDTIDDGDFSVKEIVDSEIKYIESKDSHVYSNPEANLEFDEMDPSPLIEGNDLNDLNTFVNDLKAEMDLMDTPPKIPEDFEVNPREFAKATDFCTRNS